MPKKTVTGPQLPDVEPFNQEPLDESTQPVPDNPTPQKEAYLAGRRHSTPDSDDDATRQAPPYLSASAAHLSFMAAGSQFNALARFGSDALDPVSIDDRNRAAEQRRKEFEKVFLSDSALEIDSHGDLRDYLKYLRAVEAIQAKAFALGYGGLSKSVPITSVPGGYVGRYGGNDIYAAV